MSNNPIFSYTKRDYESSRQEGISQIPVLSKGNWTDLNPTDPGIIILDYLHALVDMVNYYQDHQALETFLPTAKERANIFRLAKQLSYKIPSAKSARCVVTFSNLHDYEYTIHIPKYTKLSTESGIPYITAEDSYLPPKQLDIDILCIQGVLNTITYQGTGVSRLNSELEAENQSIRIVDENIDIDSIKVVDKLGNTWTPVSHILFTNSNSKSYQVEMNPDNSITINFGDGVRGVVPQPTDYLDISYISTKADEGRVGAGTITQLTDIILDKQKDPIYFTVYNKKPSSGGSPAQSSREIRELAPGAIKAQDRAVTLEDYENLAKLVDGVADAKAYDINTQPDFCLYHEVKLLITPEDESEDSEILKQSVYDYLSRRMIPPTSLQVLLPAEENLDIEVTLSILSTTNQGRVTYLVEEAVLNYFSENRGGLGESFDPTKLRGILSSIEGVRNIVSMTPANLVTIGKLSTYKFNSLKVNIV